MKIGKFKITTEAVILLLILAVGIFLRFYRIIPNLTLNGEMGRDYMDVWGMYKSTHTFLIGPRTSHEWLFLSPICYWIFLILFLLTNFNPVSVSIFFAILGSAAIYVCYYYVKKLFGKEVGLVSSFLLAVSPSWLEHTRNSRYNVPAAILFFPYLWYLFKSIKDKGKSLRVVGFILGLTMSFIPSPILLIPAIIACFLIYKIRPKIKYILYSVLAFFVPNITFIIYELGNGFKITFQLLAWVPYRILGFFGLQEKNNANPEVLKQNFGSIYNFFNQMFTPNFSAVSSIIFTLAIAGGVFWFIKSLSDKKTNMAFIILFVNLIVAYIGMFIHGNPPSHYYLIIFPIPLILLAYVLVRTVPNKKAVLLATLLIALLSIWGLISSDWFYKDKVRTEYPDNMVPYSLQKEVVNAISKDAGGSEFAIGRVGFYDQFENNLAGNYIFLLVTRGEKVNQKAATRYTIVEAPNPEKEIMDQKIWAKDGVVIYKMTK